MGPLIVLCDHDSFVGNFGETGWVTKGGEEN